MNRWAVALAAGLWLAAGDAGDAHAFCRSTTCRDNCPLDEHGCKTTGMPLQWRGMCVGISVQEDASRHIPLEVARPTIVAAFSEWSRRPCDDGAASLAFMETPDASCHEVEYVEGGPNANVVMFQDDKWTYGGTDNTLGMTTVTFDADTGEILDADVEINHALNELTIADDRVVYDVQSIVTHEAGHLLGLDHSRAAETIMNASYVPESIEHRSLDVDDVAAVCAAYPPDRQATCGAPQGGFTGDCAGAESEEGCGIAAPRSPARAPGAAGAGLVMLLWAACRRRFAKAGGSRARRDDGTSAFWDIGGRVALARLGPARGVRDRSEHGAE